MDNGSKRLSTGKNCSLWGIVLNLFLFSIKLLVSIFSGSLSAVTDALNNLTDASASIVSLIGFRFSEKRADSEHPYGHARAEYLSALVVAMFTFFIGFELIKSAVSEIISPSHLKLSPMVFALLALSVVIKIIMAVFNHRAGKKINSGTLLATAADSRNDAIITTGVIASYIITHFFKVAIDGYISLAIAVFICFSAFFLVKSTFGPLLGQAPDKSLVDYIHQKILSYPSVLGAHDLILHDYGPHKRFASVHVEMAAENDVMESHDIIDSMERDFLLNDNINMIVHLDPIVTDLNTRSLRQSVSQIASKIHPECTIHDLRILNNEVSFDCVKPADCNMSDEALITAFDVAIRMSNPDYRVKITIDSSFSPIIH